MISHIKLLSSSFSIRSLLIPRWSILPTQSCAKCSTRANVPTYTPLLDVVSSRQAQARRSVLVQVAGPDSASDLAGYCHEQFGKVASLHYYKNMVSKNFTDFFIVEFESADSVKEVMGGAQHSVGEGGSAGPVPVCSPFLWLQGGERKTSQCSVPVELGEDLDRTEQQVRNMVGVSDQMYHVWKMQTMTDTSLRMRFLVSRQVELAISGMFPRAQVLPFGSAVNGFGSCSSDQDMILVLDNDRKEEVSSRLVFHAKGAVYGGDRAQVQRYCEEVASIIQSFLPGCQDVQKILNARVPLIKYTHQLAGLECDLSMSSSSGLHMSCLLHLWGDMDWRVRPLVSTVRRWARGNGLVKEVRPTHFFTNFTLTMLVVCYLQQVHTMLPSLNTLVDMSTPTDSYTCEDGVNIQFLHNINGLKDQLNLCYSSDISLSHLFQDFLSFCSTYSFFSQALCPISGSSKPKDLTWRNSSAMDIINPLEPELNVSYNVNSRAVDMFQERCRQTMVKLETLNEAEEQGEIVKEGLFWLLCENSQQKQKQKFALPKIQDLGMKQGRQKERKEEIKQLFQMSAAPSNASTGKQVGVKNEQNPSDVSRGVQMIDVKDLFDKKKKQSKVVSDQHKEVLVGSEEKHEEGRVEKLKAKYLRQNHHSTFSQKL
eukprot:GFUD01006194.1.p1 GENE.GFUD01006194.1~~GFUD01006194.1.p1  ORF type:complete len:653 (-),score=224.23 GFUD01006194.1:52-2010(-)